MNSDMAESDGLVVRVRAVMSKLGADEAAAARMRLEGCSVADIAASMGRDAATVRQWLTRAEALATSAARGHEQRQPTRSPAKPPPKATKVLAGPELPPEWEARLAAAAGPSAVRRVRGLISAEELKVVVLRIEGLTEGDIARQLGVAKGTVNMRLVRARKKLAEDAPEVARRLWHPRVR